VEQNSSKNIIKGIGMAKKSPTLQEYTRESGSLLAKADLFPRLKTALKKEIIESAIDMSFQRCTLKKSGKVKEIANSPEQLVDLCIEHLRSRSDPIISPYFVSQCNIESLFELDAVSHEMQRHRMTIGTFYQYLLLELMRKRWQVFDGSREGDIVADIDTPNFASGLRLYISVKKSMDTVGGQDVGGIIQRLENIAKQEKNLTRPYLCVICVATPSNGKVQPFLSDRYVKCDHEKRPYSLNCEYWGPGFIFPFIAGREAMEIYLLGIQRVSEYLPFWTLQYRKECNDLLKKRFQEMNLLDEDGKISSIKFLEFSCMQVKK